MVNIPMHYVYAYIRKSNLTPYYIGKGKDRRAFQKHCGISVPKDRSKIIFIETNLSDVGACAIERRLIQWYGRKDLGTGILLNKTNGGDGSAGYVTKTETKNKLSLANIGKKHTAKTKEKMSSKKIGNRNGINSPGNTGIKHTEETRRKISEAGKGRLQSEYTKQLLSLQRKGIPKPKLECPHCGRLFSPTNMARYHGDKCKLK
jgi:hypothetical protein